MKNAQQLTFNRMECVFVCFVELTFVHTMYVVCLFNDFNVSVFKFNVNGELSITDENYYETRESKKERTMSNYRNVFLFIFSKFLQAQHL